VSGGRAPDAARLRRAALRLAYGLRAPATRYGLTPSRLAALVILGKQGPMRVGDVARELNIAVPSASRLLDVLAESGFVERRDDPTDRRAFLVSLTADGARILEDVRADGIQELAGHLASLTAAQRAAAEAALPALEALADAFTQVTEPPRALASTADELAEVVAPRRR
jgi:DNA-binding MarR family transcriptional regulator